MQVDTPLEKIEKITYRYSLEDAEKSMKKIITRLLIHHNEPTWLFFLDVFQRAKEDFVLRQNIKIVYEQHKEETSYEDELKRYSDEGLQIFEAKLSKEMHAIPKSDPLHAELFERYVAICTELDRRDLTDDIPF
jgi:hypothetical protein